ncbi:DNA glycosylase [Podospora appendiculata]|uniref:DNA glycosylase n=1 Tax=Podospora appendiculata TaxID=314037 RepID=A0AAE0XIA2_9PEZI|nr:DNA glycosylase [Podospora appendiculata]
MGAVTTPLTAPSKITDTSSRQDGISPSAPSAKTTQQTRLAFRVTKAPTDSLQKRRETSPLVAPISEIPSKRRLAADRATTQTQTEPTHQNVPSVPETHITNTVPALTRASPKAPSAVQIRDSDYRVRVRSGKDNLYELAPGYSPYPCREIPTPEACEEIPTPSLEVAGCGEVPCVLDALLRTVISANTLMELADAAIKDLAKRYGVGSHGSGAGSINWEQARLSSHEDLVNVIRKAGNGPTRAHHIKRILDMVHEENTARFKNQSAAENGGEDANAAPAAAHQHTLSLDHMRSLTKDEAMAKFVSYPGIGIKTVACVPCFAVDTHVYRFCRWLGWVPEKANADNCFRHGDIKIPDHLKYGLHQLFIRHGQDCFKCKKITKPGTKDWNESGECPLEHLLDRSKDEARGAKMTANKRAQAEVDSVR